jgi:F420-non-reducing hydrogenase iron-sulfur subunit
VNYVKGLLDEIGLGGERLEMVFLSSAEGVRWSEIVTEMTQRIKALGLSPLRVAVT